MLDAVADGHAATGPSDEASLAYLLARLELLETRVREAVDRRRAGDPDPDDRFRGLYISDAQVDELLGNGIPTRAAGVPSPEPPAYPAPEAEADHREEQGAAPRLRALRLDFGLDELDLELLLIALAPDLDTRFERLYGYLQDDVSRRRASIGLALELAGMSPVFRSDRLRLAPAAPLVSGGLVLVEEPDRPFLTRSLRVPDRVAAHLLGDDRPDPALTALLATEPAAPLPEASLLARALAGGSTAYLRERPGSAGLGLVFAAAAWLGKPALALDLSRLGPNDDVAAIASAALRDARLRRAVLAAGPIDALAERGPFTARAFGDLAGTVVLLGSRAWDPAWSARAVFLIEAPVPTLAQRTTLVTASLDGDAHLAPDLVRALLPFRLSPAQVSRTVEAARTGATIAGRSMTPDDVRAGARGQNAAGLDRLARRIEPRAAWSDLVLPDEVRAQLRELAVRARHRERVLDEWGIGGRASRGRGVTALFAGDSGTGKTMSAEVVAGELGLDLYVIDLSTVVDKYIGETEKNLDRIFTEADRVNGVLLFDEADAIFGKRSEVRDARDRYANVEVAYLLQRMERFDGLAVLTTNLRSNLDDAFTRRLDAIVDFSMPEEEDRLRLWEMHLPSELPRARDIDLPFMARRFRLSGGNIRNVCLTAAFLAAEDDRAVGMADLIRGTEREYRKLGRLTVEAEFGPYLNLARPSA